ncbi:MAG: flavodoxin family protein [Ignavibacteriales bacterium]
MSKIIGICGSPRQNGNSEMVLNLLSTELLKIGVEFENILLSCTDIKMCKGCLSCEDYRDCPLKDDTRLIFDKMVRADVIVFATPSYFDNIPGLLKNFLDRSNLIVNNLKGKKVVIIVVGQADEKSRLSAAKAIKSYCDITSMEVIDEKTFQTRRIGDLIKDETAKEELYDISKLIIASLN